jgi:hypothetical protein
MRQGRGLPETSTALMDGLQVGGGGNVTTGDSAMDMDMDVMDALTTVLYVLHVIAVVAIVDFSSQLLQHLRFRNLLSEKDGPSLGICYLEHCIPKAKIPSTVMNQSING